MVIRLLLDCYADAVGGLAHARTRTRMRMRAATATVVAATNGECLPSDAARHEPRRTRASAGKDIKAKLFGQISHERAGRRHRRRLVQHGASCISRGGVRSIASATASASTVAQVGAE